MPKIKTAGIKLPAARKSLEFGAFAAAVFSQEGATKMEEITLDSKRAEIEAQVDKIAHKYGYNSIGGIPMLDLEQPAELAWANALSAAAFDAEIAAKRAYLEQLGKSLADYISLDNYMYSHSSLSADEAKAALRKVIRHELDLYNRQPQAARIRNRRRKRWINAASIARLGKRVILT